MRWDWLDFVTGLAVGMVASPVLLYVLAGVIGGRRR